MMVKQRFSSFLLLPSFIIIVSYLSTCCVFMLQMTNVQCSSNTSFQSIKKYASPSSSTHRIEDLASSSSNNKKQQVIHRQIEYFDLPRHESSFLKDSSSSESRSRSSTLIDDTNQREKKQQQHQVQKHNEYEN